VQILDAHSFGRLLTSWPPYCLLAAALIGMWLMQNSFNAAPLHASLPGITAAEPVAGILLGVVVFGDRINISPGLLALQAAGIAALVVGVIMVARSPRLGQLRPSAVIPDSVMPGLISGKGSLDESSPSAAMQQPEPAEQRSEPQPVGLTPEPGAKASRRPAAGGARSMGML
jgi:drug/metabolite transporter (DMT)-like permease